MNVKMNRMKCYEQKALSLKGNYIRACMLAGSISGSE